MHKLSVRSQRIANTLHHVLGHAHDGIFVVRSVVVHGVAAPHGRGGGPVITNAADGVATKTIVVVVAIVVPVESSKRILHRCRLGREGSLRGSSAPAICPKGIVVVAAAKSVVAKAIRLLQRFAIEGRKRILGVSPGGWRCSQISKRAAAVVVVVVGSSKQLFHRSTSSSSIVVVVVVVVIPKIVSC